MARSRLHVLNDMDAPYPDDREGALTASAEQQAEAAQPAGPTASEMDALVAQVRTHIEPGIRKEYEGRLAEAIRNLDSEEKAAQRRAAGERVLAFLRVFATVVLEVVKYVVMRAPALGVMLLGYFLWQQTLPNPDMPQLVGLALYGIFIVLPAVYLSLKGER